jgi:hypothetical protein
MARRGSGLGMRVCDCQSRNLSDNRSHTTQHIGGVVGKLFRALQKRDDGKRSEWLEHKIAIEWTVREKWCKAGCDRISTTRRRRRARWRTQSRNPSDSAELNYTKRLARLVGQAELYRRCAMSRGPCPGHAQMVTNRSEV